MWDNGSEEGELAEEFADYIDDAQDDEHTLAVYGGATLVAAVVGIATKNPVWSDSSFKAVCLAAGVVVSYGLLDAGSSYFNNLDNARENYFKLERLLDDMKKYEYKVVLHSAKLGFDFERKCKELEK
ncbi:MAG: hypothetical protein PHY44_06200 [Lachnospiraceae bacterium]|nr:hypothetical protein [Lachnospiraceae bacterium]